MAKPILKWAGGKTQLLPHLRKLIPKYSGKYYEPFIGGGALFFDHEPNSFIISDINPELINFYTAIRDYPEEIMLRIDELKNDRDVFYEIRNQNFHELTPINAAVRMLYLNKTCFNGLYRVNKKGGFNVPFANYKNPSFYSEENVLAASRQLKNGEIKLSSFESLAEINITQDDFVFFDPPYVPVSKYSDFKRYNKEQFNLEQHETLSNLFSELSKKGVKLILTNSDTEIVKELYSGYQYITVEAKRNINSDGSKRKANELIIYSNI